jgi:hypothetical protein
MDTMIRSYIVLMCDVCGDTNVVCETCNKYVIENEICVCRPPHHWHENCYPKNDKKK